MVLVTLIVMIILVATIGMAWRGDDQNDPVTSPYVDVTSLEPFNTTATEEIFLQVGEESRYLGLLIFFYMLELPQEDGQVSICFIDHISVRLYWMDEPDESGYIWGYENQPDTVMFSMTDLESWVEFTQEATNVHGEEAEIQFDWNGDGKYFATALDFDGEHHYSGVNGWEYIQVDNESVGWDNHLVDLILVVEAGDQVHERLPFVQVDDGNRISYDVTISGYFQRFGP